MQTFLVALELDLFLLDLGLEVGLVGGHVLDVVLNLLNVVLHGADRQLQSGLNLLYKCGFVDSLAYRGKCTIPLPQHSTYI